MMYDTYNAQVLTTLLQEDMQGALGVTEPGAIAFAVAKARSYIPGGAVKIAVAMNSGMYKNAFTCGIPNSDETGSAFAAALGFIAGDASLGLKALAAVTPADNAAAKALVDRGQVTVQVRGITSRIFIEAAVTTTAGTCTVTICDKHTNIVKIIRDDAIVFTQEQPVEPTAAATPPDIHRYTLTDLHAYCSTVPLSDIAFISQAYEMNMALFTAGLHSPRTSFTHSLFKQNGNTVISGDELATAQLLCSGAIEARVLGSGQPAMSITGSGAHGIICTLPLYAVYKVSKLTKEQLLRATALSYLITIYIKEYSGRLSAFCGCAIAAGTGMACALACLKGGTIHTLDGVINNMASGITGMICDGGNHGCTLKGIIAVDAAFRAVRFALADICIADIHGINGRTPEETFRNMGRIASPGMTGTEQTITDIFTEKSCCSYAK